MEFKEERNLDQQYANASRSFYCTLMNLKPILFYLENNNVSKYLTLSLCIISQDYQ